MIARSVSRSIFLALLAGLSGAGSAEAASFDCARARAHDEIAVCGDRQLSELDVEMATLWRVWSRLPMAMGSNGARRDDAQEFLKARGACAGDAACLGKLYRVRIATLQNDLGDWLEAAGVQQGLFEPAPPALPPAIEDLIAGYAKQCADIVGVLKPGADRPAMMSADFDGDGQPDYLLDPATLQCSAAASLYCPNAGCDIKIALSGNGYRAPIMVFGGLPRISLENDETGTKLWASVSVAVGADKCNVPKFEQACRQIFSWKGGKVQQSFEAQDLPK